MVSGPEHPRTARLSPREREILRFVAEGLSSREVGRRLSISAGTVANHRRTILLKLGVRETVSAVRWAWLHGIMTPPSSGSGCA